MRNQIREDQVDGKNSKVGFFEIGFSRIEKHQSLFVMPPSRAHELGREVLDFDRDSPPATFLKNIPDFILAGFSAAKGWLDGGESIGPRQSDHLNEIAKQFVLKVQTAQVFGGKSSFDSEFSGGIDYGDPAIGMLVFFHVRSSKADCMFRAFGIKTAWISDGRQQTRGKNHLPLGFCDFMSPAFKTLSSTGVCAKNSARDIAGKEARALAELIFSAIFR